MPNDIPSLTLVLDARRRAAEATAGLDPDAALEALVPLDAEFPWPARAEIWEAMAKVGTAAAGSRLLLISESLTDKSEKKRMRQVIHGLRSRGVPVEMPASVEPIGLGGIPPLRTWVSCVDGEGAYQLLAHLHMPRSGICGMACFAVTRGARDVAVFPVKHPREVRGLLEKLEKASEEGMPPVHAVDPDVWLDIAERAVRDHVDGGFVDPEDYAMWAPVLEGVGKAVGPRAGRPDPAPVAPDDPEEMAFLLLDLPDYQTWFFDGKDLSRELVDRAGFLVHLPPTESTLGKVRELSAEMLAAVDADRLKALWQRGLRHNARVHAGLDGLFAGEAMWFADLFDRIPFREHPLAREVARLSPWRLFEFAEEPDAVEGRDDPWETKGWSALEGLEGRERLERIEEFVEFWVGDQPEAALHREEALKRQWGRDGVEYISTSKLHVEVLLPASWNFLYWDYRKTYRSKTLVESLLPRIDGIPAEAQSYYRARMNAVTSIYQILDLLDDGTVVVEDYLNDSRLIVEVRGRFTEAARGSYPLLIGKVFPVGRVNWLAMACPPLTARLKPLLVDFLEHAIRGWQPRRVTVDELKRRPQEIWRALRAADEELSRVEDQIRQQVERLPVHPGGPLDLNALTPEEREPLLRAVREKLVEHYTRWMDESIPALGYRTPRKAAKDPEGRRLLVDLLRDMEARHRGEPFDLKLGDLFAKMRRELGVER